MAPRIIYQADGWTIIQDPTMAGRNDLVRFRCHNGRRCLLDQIAKWTPDGWSSSRWIPKSPKVPLLLINWVVGHMRMEPLRKPRQPDHHPLPEHDSGDA